LIAARLFGAALACLLAPAFVHAEPQGHVGVRLAPCGVGEDGAFWQHTRFCGGLTADLLLLRERNTDFGLGPYVEISSAGVWDVRYGGGLSLLAPVHPDFPLVVSAGAYGHETRAVALGGSLFFGMRSYNFHGNYNLTLGLFGSVTRDLGASEEMLTALGVELDGFLIAAPFLLAFEALR
jgi:hypothetical protein